MQAMAKRPTVEVDEDYLKEVMAGGALPKKEHPKPEAGQQPAERPSASRLQAEPPVKEEENDIAEQAAQRSCPKETAPPETGEPSRPVRKRKEAQDYESLFLKRKAGALRRQIYISSSLYEKIGSFLPVIAGRLSITGYIDNILTHHLEQYRDDINGLYEKKSQKPF
jgi:hypothetical protein